MAKRDELEAMIVENPDDRGSWQVYADRLLEEGEPWGEAIVKAWAGQSNQAQQDEVERAWIEGLDGVTITWSRGVVDSVTVAPEKHLDTVAEEGRMPAALQRIVGHPAGRWLRSLTLGLPPRADITWHFEDVIAAVTAGPPLPLLGVVDLTPHANHMDQQSWRRIGDISSLWRAAPRLRELRLRGSSGSDGGAPIVFGDVQAPHLDKLVYISSGLDARAPVELGQAKLPRLRHLELYLGQEHYGNTCTIESLAGILDGAGLPALETLGLKNSEWEANLIEAIAASSVVRRIKHLDLSLGVLCADGTAALLAYADRLVHLESIDLDDNYFSDQQVGAIRQALPRARFGEQRHVEDPDEDYRYCSVGE